MSSTKKEILIRRSVGCIVGAWFLGYGVAQVLLPWHILHTVTHDGRGLPLVMVWYGIVPLMLLGVLVVGFILFAMVITFCEWAFKPAKKIEKKTRDERIADLERELGIAREEP